MLELPLNILLDLLFDCLGSLAHKNVGVCAKLNLYRGHVICAEDLIQGDDVDSNWTSAGTIAKFSTSPERYYSTGYSRLTHHSFSENIHVQVDTRQVPLLSN